MTAAAAALCPNSSARSRPYQATIPNTAIANVYVAMRALKINVAEEKLSMSNRRPTPRIRAPMAKTFRKSE
jgi:hypothetical protein